MRDIDNKRFQTNMPFRLNFVLFPLLSDLFKGIILETQNCKALMFDFKGSKKLEQPAAGAENFLETITKTTNPLQKWKFGEKGGSS